jgi:hypothetical protein
VHCRTDIRTVLALCGLVAALALSGIAGCAVKKPVQELGAPGSNTSIYSPEGVYDNAAIKQAESDLLAAVGGPTSMLPGPTPEMGSYLIYRYATMETRVNIRDGAVFKVELVDITGGQEKVVKSKSLESTPAP